jgi:GT2 family glycosyltransferase
VASPLHSISVVIPTLNEAESLTETVHRARANPEVSEIIVVDGGSRDDTMRIGAVQARGDVVLLLHADTWLPPEAGRAALKCLSDPAVVAGGFWKTFRDGSWLMLGSRFRCGLRLWLGGRVLGDQGMFVRRDALDKIGGIPDMPLMEDVELCRRVRKAGRLVLAEATVTTSARRFAKLGVIRTYLRMWMVMIRYRLGASPEKLRSLYEK